MSDLKDRYGLVEELSKVMAEVATIEKLKEVYAHSIRISLSKENPEYIPDYMVIDMCKNYDVDVSKFVEN